MKKCSLCGRKISQVNYNFGLGCLKKSCKLIDINAVKNIKGENTLNNSICKLCNKQDLNKKQKELLTNRYLTYNILNKVELDYYTSMKDKVNQDIKIINKNTNKKDLKSFDVITLKQAFEIYRLYNKYKKIRDKREEVDFDFIQNTSFDTLRFAFSTYYNRKTYLNGVTADGQYIVWELGIIYLKSTSKKCSATLLKHSLQESPDDLLIESGEFITKIKKDIYFKKKINEIIEKNKEQDYLNETGYIDFNIGDLFFALHSAKINIKGNKVNNIWKLNIIITDRYDFTDFKKLSEYMDSNIFKSIFTSTINNMAMISTSSNVINEYNVTIKFSIDWSDNL